MINDIKTDFDIFDSTKDDFSTTYKILILKYLNNAFKNNKSEVARIKINILKKYVICQNNHDILHANITLRTSKNDYSLSFLVNNRIKLYLTKKYNKYKNIK